MVTELPRKTLLSSRFKLVTALLMLVLIGFGDCEGASRPNVVIFLADDAGWGDYSHSGADDSMVWRLKVQTTGRYDVVVEYTWPEADAGSLIELTCGRGRVTGSVTPGWDPPLYSNQDTLPRPRGESTMKAFRPLKLGVISLTKGEAPLILRALEIPQKSVMEVRRITLTLLDEETQP